MKIALRNHRNEVSKVDIPDNTTEIAVIEISGDEVLVYPVLYDTGYGSRTNDFIDGHKIFRVSDLKDTFVEGEICLYVPKNMKVKKEESRPRLWMICDGCGEESAVSESDFYKDKEEVERTIRTIYGWKCPVCGRKRILNTSLKIKG